MSDIVILGNGILGQVLAFKILKKHPQLSVSIIGPDSRPGSATLAAGAMLNCFAELEVGSLDHEIDRTKFEASKTAYAEWKTLLNELNAYPDNQKLEVKAGTIILNNAASNHLDDNNYQAIINYLNEYKEPYEEINPAEIKGYKPAPRQRALKAIKIRDEGYLNPKSILQSLENALSRFERFRKINANAKSIEFTQDKVSGIILNDGTVVKSDRVVLAAGAASTELLSGTPLATIIPRIFYGIGCSLIIQTGDETPSTVIRTPNRGLACGIYQVPYTQTTSCIGATNFISPVPEPYARLTSIEALLRAAMEQLNTNYYKSQLLGVNIGYRPTSADTYPLMGKTSLEGLYLMTGTKRDGFHMAPIWARHIADAMFNNEESHLLKVFKPERSLIRTLSLEQGIQKSVEHMLSAAYQHDLELPKSGWENNIAEFLRSKVTEVYTKAGVTEFGIPPELIEMYRYGHIQR